MPQRQPMSRALLLTILLSIQAAAADIATVVQQCEDCHGKNGVSDFLGLRPPVDGRRPREDHLGAEAARPFHLDL